MRVFEHVYTRGKKGFGTVLRCNELSEHFCEHLNTRYLEAFSDVKAESYMLSTFSDNDVSYLLFSCYNYVERPSAVENRAHAYVDTFVVPEESWTELCDALRKEADKYLFGASFSTSYDIEMPEISKEYTNIPIDQNYLPSDKKVASSEYAISVMLNCLIHGTNVMVPLDCTQEEVSEYGLGLMSSLYQHAGWLMDVDAPWTFVTLFSSLFTYNTDTRIKFYVNSSYSNLVSNLRNKVVLAPYNKDNDESEVAENAFLTAVAKAVYNNIDIPYVDIMRTAREQGILNDDPELVKHAALYEFLCTVMTDENITYETFYEVYMKVKSVFAKKNLCDGLLRCSLPQRIIGYLRNERLNDKKCYWSEPDSTSDSESAYNTAIECCEAFDYASVDKTIIRMLYFILAVGMDYDMASDEYDRYVQKYYSYMSMICSQCKSVTEMAEIFAIPQRLMKSVYNAIVDSTSAPLYDITYSVIGDNYASYDLHELEELMKRGSQLHALCAYKALCSRPNSFLRQLDILESFFDVASDCYSVIKKEIEDWLETINPSENVPLSNHGVSVSIRLILIFHNTVFKEQCNALILSKVIPAWTVMKSGNEDYARIFMVLALINDDEAKSIRLDLINTTESAVVHSAAQMMVSIVNRLSIPACIDVVKAIKLSSNDLLGIASEDPNVYTKGLSDNDAVKKVIANKMCNVVWCRFVHEKLKKMLSKKELDNVYEEFKYFVQGSNNKADWEKALLEIFITEISVDLSERMKRIRSEQRLDSVVEAGDIISKARCLRVERVFTVSISEVYLRVLEVTHFDDYIVQLVAKSVDELVRIELIPTFSERLRWINEFKKSADDVLTLLGINITKVISDAFKSYDLMSTLSSMYASSILSTLANNTSDELTVASEIKLIFESLDQIGKLLPESIKMNEVLMSALQRCKLDRKHRILGLFYGEKIPNDAEQAKKINMVAEYIRNFRISNHFDAQQEKSSSNNLLETDSIEYFYASVQRYVGDVSMDDVTDAALTIADRKIEACYAARNSSTSNKDVFALLLGNLYELYLKTYDAYNLVQKKHIGTTVDAWGYTIGFKAELNTRLYELMCKCKCECEYTITVEEFTMLINTYIDRMPKAINKDNSNDIGKVFSDFITGTLELFSYGFETKDCDIQDKEIIKAMKGILKRMKSAKIINCDTYKRLKNEFGTHTLGKNNQS